MGSKPVSTVLGLLPPQGSVLVLAAAICSSVDPMLPCGSSMDPTVAMWALGLTQAPRLVNEAQSKSLTLPVIVIKIRGPWEASGLRFWHALNELKALQQMYGMLPFFEWLITAVNVVGIVHFSEIVCVKGQPADLKWQRLSVIPPIVTTKPMTETGPELELTRQTEELKGIIS
eukprot:Gb_02354 [translate_table: standard]